MNIKDIMTIFRKEEVHIKDEDVVSKIIETMFVEGVDYGSLPGCNSKFFYKHGSELILSALHLTADVTIIDKMEDVANGYFSYTSCAKLINRKKEVVSVSYAVCNSKEARYATTMNPFDLQNIVIQLSRKRAIISATLTVANLSSRFSMDPDLVEAMRDKSTRVENKTPKAISPKQITFIEALIDQGGTTIEETNRYVMSTWNISDYHEINGAQASELISKLKSLGQQ